MHTIIPNQPLVQAPDNWRGYAETSYRIKLTIELARLLPRGYAAVPRWLGRKLFHNLLAHIKLPDGSLLACDASNLDSYTALLRRSSVWDSNVVHWCCRSLSPGAVFFDVGANCGSVTIPVARQADPSCRIIAFEPIRTLAEHIAVSAQLNHLTSTSVLAFALGDRSKLVALAQPGPAGQASTICNSPHGTTHHVPMTSIDELVRQRHLPPPDVMKVDVEGGEIAVFAGARKVLTSSEPTIIFEANYNMTRAGTNLTEILDLLCSCAQYKFFNILGHGLSPLPSDGDSDGHSENILAIPQSRREVLIEAEAHCAPPAT